MAEGFNPIPRIQEGGISLMSAAKANEVIDLVNALGAAQISPYANIGKMMMAGGRAIYDFAALDSRLRAIEYRLGHANITASGTCNANVITINIGLNI